MPTYLRLIIMLGEIIGFIVFSIIRINYYRNNMRSDLKGISIYYIILNVMLVSTFFFSFPTIIFLSYSKIICLSCMFTTFLMLSIGGIIDNNSNTKIKIITVGLLYTFGVIGGLISFIMPIGGSIQVAIDPEHWMQFKTCINEEVNIETINPEIYLTDKSKIGHYLDYSGDVDNYIFFYQDSNNNWCKVDEPIESKNTKILSDNESSYVEKYVSTKTILNLELDESDDNYITTEETVSYKLYYNPKELIEITN